MKLLPLLLATFATARRFKGINPCEFFSVNLQRYPDDFCGDPIGHKNGESFRIHVRSGATCQNSGKHPFSSYDYLWVRPFENEELYRAIHDPTCDIDGSYRSCYLYFYKEEDCYGQSFKQSEELNHWDLIETACHTVTRQDNVTIATAKSFELGCYDKDGELTGFE